MAIEQEVQKAEKSPGAVALAVQSWSFLGGGFLAFSFASMVGDMTPIPFDGTFFGEIGGMFMTALMLKAYRTATTSKTKSS